MIKNIFDLIRSKQKTFAKSLIIILVSNLIGHTLIQAAEPKKDAYSKLAQLHLPSMVKEEMIERQEQEKIKKENQEINLDKDQNGLVQVKITPLGEVEKLRMFYTLFSSNEQDQRGDDVLNENVFSDLEFFCGGKQSLHEHLFAALNLTETKMGSIELQKILAHPTNDIQELTRRQNIVRELVENKSLFNTLDQKIKTIKHAETDFIWMWKTLDDEVEKYFNSVYYQWKMCQDLNKNDEMLELRSIGNTVVSPAIAIGSPMVVFMSYYIAYVLISWSIGENPRSIGWIMRQIYDHRDEIWGFIDEFIAGFRRAPLSIQLATIAPWSVLAYLYYRGCKQTIDNVVLNNAITNQIHGRMNNVAHVTNSLHEMYSVIQKNSILATSVSEAATIKNLFTQTADQSAAYGVLVRLASETFKDEPSFFSNRGKVLASYKIFKDVKDKTINALKATGTIDAYLSIAKLYKKYAQHPNAQFCFPVYISQNTPYINIKNYWHPILNADKVVTNSIEQGNISQARNVILTGPNAGGKSTNLKAITISLILAQTLGITPAHEMTLTPFKLINTYLNIADTEGKESLFQAEMHRAQALLDQVRQLGSKELAFVIMDEIFTGTNPKEGMAAAYGIAKKLSSYKNSMAVIATHFMVMTDLAQDTNGLFENYKVYANKENGRITYPYTLEKGITDQAIALELLEQEGFDSEILQDAYNVINRKQHGQNYQNKIDQK